MREKSKNNSILEKNSPGKKWILSTMMCSIWIRNQAEGGVFIQQKLLHCRHNQVKLDGLLSTRGEIKSTAFSWHLTVWGHIFLGSSSYHWKSAYEVISTRKIYFPSAHQTILFFFFLSGLVTHSVSHLSHPRKKKFWFVLSPRHKIWPIRQWIRINDLYYILMLHSVTGIVIVDFIFQKWMNKKC